MASKSDALKVVCNVGVYTDRPNGWSYRLRSKEHFCGAVKEKNGLGILAEERKKLQILIK